MLLQVHANRMAYRTLLDGDPPLARLRRQQAPRGDFVHALANVGGEFIIGLTYLWEGQSLLAENLLQPALASAEAELGRRGNFACMLAAAVWERGRPDEAAALLADRLDVLERCGLPEALLLGYRTMARIAVIEGTEHRAIELLNAMDAAGSARGLPRLRIASLSDQVRIHARRFRWSQTCRDLCARIDALLADPSLPQGRHWRRNTTILRDLAHGYAAIATQDWRGALAPLARVDDMAKELKQGRLHIEVMGLRAFVLDRCGEKSQPLLREAMDLAQAYGLTGIFDDAHPDLGELVRKLTGAGSDSVLGTSASLTLALHIKPKRALPPPDTRHRMLLTAKEREVLDLLARNLTNKEIGRAMQAGETTIKWHVRNLLGKLDAGTRKEVVHRARLLGVIRPLT